MTLLEMQLVEAGLQELGRKLWEQDEFYAGMVDKEPLYIQNNENIF